MIDGLLWWPLRPSRWNGTVPRHRCGLGCGLNEGFWVKKCCFADDPPESPTGSKAVAQPACCGVTGVADQADSNPTGKAGTATCTAHAKVFLPRPGPSSLPRYLGRVWGRPQPQANLTSPPCQQARYLQMTKTTVKTASPLLTEN